MERQATASLHTKDTQADFTELKSSRTKCVIREQLQFLDGIKMVSRWYQLVNSRKVAKHWTLSRMASLPIRALWTRKAAPLLQESSAGTHQSSQQRGTEVVRIKGGIQSAIEMGRES